MKIEIINKEASSISIMEMPQIPHEGEEIETVEGTRFQIIQVTHTPWSKDVVARVTIGRRNSMGLI